MGAALMTPCQRRTRSVAVAAAAVALVTSCTSDPSPTTETVARPEADQSSSAVQESLATYADTECPVEVSSVVFGDVTCGYLTVPENRAGSGADIRVFVTRVKPAGDTTLSEPVLVIGTELGSVPNYGGIAPLAERVGREVVIVDTRGTGHSEPALECPEVEDLALPAVAVGTDDESAQRDFLEAVGTCHGRLTSEGIDPASYNLGEMAADAEDLRVALGIDTWNVVSYGTTSRIALELVRRTPEHVRALVLDTPEVPGMDPRIVGVDRTEAMLDAVLEACAADVRCLRRFPDVQGSLAQALTELQRDPIALTLEGVGGPTPALLDPAMLVRVLRQMFSDGASRGPLMQPGSVPAILEAVVTRRTGLLETALGEAVMWPQPYCLGYLPKCLRVHMVSVAVTYSVLCHDVDPFSDVSSLPKASQDVPGFGAAFGHSPYLGVCGEWQVGEAEPDVAAPVESSVPTLVLLGEFATHAPPATVRAALRGLTKASFVIDAGGSHNVSARTECMLEVRNAWLENPTAGIRTPRCLRTSTIRWEL